MKISPRRPSARVADEPAVVRVVRQRNFARLLAFAGLSIDDVVSCPRAKRAMANWFKTDRRLHRRLEALELERHWNPLR